MAINFKDQNNGEEKVEIKLNRKMRTWNKYRNYIIIGGSVLIVVLLLVLILRGCNGDKDSKINETTTAEVQQTTSSVTDQTQQTEQTTTTAVQPTTATQTGSTAQISGTAEDQTFVGRDQFSGITFVGDSIVSGFSFYGYIDGANVISDGNMTSDKLSDYVGDIAATNPSKVVLMAGLNDLNYGTRGASTIADYIASFVEQVKSSVPSAKVYVLSVLPVTSSFEAGANINITQSGIDELNNLLSTQASAKGYNYIDAATSFKDGTGYMNDSYTGNGSNIYNEYYPFLLNGLAGVMK